MTEADDGKDCLRRGDAREYLAYCEHVERYGAPGAAPAALRLVAVRKQVLSMVPERRDVRRTLAENYVQLGLVDDARRELRRVAVEWDAHGDLAARDEALGRCRELG
jgi:hypothetical protein